MNVVIHPAALRRPSLEVRPLLAGGLAIATVDFLFCLAFWTPLGVGATRLLQGVAAGLLGRAAFAGGTGTAVLGACLMVLIGVGYALAYALVARHVADLRRHARALGPVYGLLLHVLMMQIVVPLSAAPAPVHTPLAWTLASLPMFFVFGTLAAVAGARALALRPVASR